MQLVVDGDLGIEVDGVCHLPAVEKEPRSYLIALSPHSLFFPTLNFSPEGWANLSFQAHLDPKQIVFEQIQPFPWWYLAFIFRQLTS